MKRKLPVAIGIIILLVLNSGCSLQFDPTGGLTDVASGSIIGRFVMGAAGKTSAKGGAITVRIDRTNRAVLTATDGRFMFNEIPPGEYGITASMGNGNKARLPRVTVKVGLTTDVSTVSLTPTGSVKGTVQLSGSGLPLGILVGLYGTDISTETGLDGSYELTDVPEGAYNVVIGRSGYATEAVENITVSSGNELVLAEVVLIKKGTSVDVSLLPLSSGNSVDMAVSHDGKYLAVCFSATGVSSDLWLYDLNHGTWFSMTASTGISERTPTWSPDDSGILFQKGYDVHIYEVSTGSASKLIDDAGCPVWSENLQRIMFERNGSVLAMDPADASTSLVLDNAFSPDVSNDGMVACSRGDGIWVSEGNGNNAQRVATSGSSPLWLHGRREILYRDGMALVRYDYGTDYREIIAANGGNAAYCRALNRVFYWDVNAGIIRAYQL